MEILMKRLVTILQYGYTIQLLSMAYIKLNARRTQRPQNAPQRFGALDKRTEWEKNGKSNVSEFNWLVQDVQTPRNMYMFYFGMSIK